MSTGHSERSDCFAMGASNFIRLCSLENRVITLEENLATALLASTSYPRVSQSQQRGREQARRRRKNRGPSWLCHEHYRFRHNADAAKCVVPCCWREKAGAGRKAGRIVGPSERRAEMNAGPSGERGAERSDERSDERSVEGGDEESEEITPESSIEIDMDWSEELDDEVALSEDLALGEDAKWGHKSGVSWGATIQAMIDAKCGEESDSEVTEWREVKLDAGRGAEGGAGRGAGGRAGWNEDRVAEWAADWVPNEESADWELD